ncbi:hypothetical protein ACTXG7_08295 [Mycolicibacterium sp. Dal123E01]|uniref:hypothetical protein n=1 Tax=Mycolicibacterium sp. Dal123E01 TaxID=3457578 RepID=UPI00403E5E58
MRALRIPVMATVLVAALSGCAEYVANPMTPEQSESQVMDAGHDLVATLNLHVVNGAFWHASCNDQGDPPFRGRLRIGYAPAASFAESETQAAQMADQLRKAGWKGDPDFHSHGTELTKDNVVAVFGPQTAITPDSRDIQLYGECRDTTTTKDTKGRVESVTVS